MVRLLLPVVLTLAFMALEAVLGLVVDWFHELDPPQRLRKGQKPQRRRGAP
ncbi:MAG TPA: hypothetical protein VLA00_05595 [Xanthobacteraceae bacterium]|nr:hypothetical protein [Xanthobacteraceae bacterium]